MKFGGVQCCVQANSNTRDAQGPENGASEAATPKKIQQCVHDKKWVSPKIYIRGMNVAIAASTRRMSTPCQQECNESDTRQSHSLLEASERLSSDSHWKDKRKNKDVQKNRIKKVACGRHRLIPPTKLYLEQAIRRLPGRKIRVKNLHMPV